MRIADSGILHETSTFLPQRTGIADFSQGFGLFRGAAMRDRFTGTNVCVGGFFDAARECDFEAVPLLWGFAYPSGLIRRDDYESLRDEFVQRLRAGDAEQPLVGRMVALHGAMVVEGIEDADGDVVAVVRQAIGPKRPIVVTYDLHGNHTLKRMQVASASVG